MYRGASLLRNIGVRKRRTRLLQTGKAMMAQLCSLSFSLLNTYGVRYETKIANTRKVYEKELLNPLTDFGRSSDKMIEVEGTIRPDASPTTNLARYKILRSSIKNRPAATMATTSLA